MFRIPGSSVGACEIPAEASVAAEVTVGAQGLCPALLKNMSGVEGVAFLSKAEPIITALNIAGTIVA